MGFNSLQNACIYGIWECQGMIVMLNKCRLNQILQLLEVHHHAIFWMPRLMNGHPSNTHFQPEGMPMNMTTRPVVSRQGVRHFKSQYFGEPYFHNMQVMTVFLPLE